MASKVATIIGTGLGTSAAIVGLGFWNHNSHEGLESRIAQDRACQQAVTTYGGHLVTESMLGKQVYADCGFITGTDQFNGAFVDAEVKLPAMAALAADIKSTEADFKNWALSSDRERVLVATGVLIGTFLGFLGGVIKTEGFDVIVPPFG